LRSKNIIHSQDSKLHKTEMAESLAPLQEVLNSVLARLAVLENNAGIVPSTKTATAAETSTPSVVTAYDEFLSTYLPPFTASCATLENTGLSPVISASVNKAFGTTLRSFIAAATECQKPSNMADLTPFFAEFSSSNKDVDRELKRDAWDNHIKSIKEGLSVMNWVMEGKPKEYILEGECVYIYIECVCDCI